MKPSPITPGNRVHATIRMQNLFAALLACLFLIQPALLLASSDNDEAYRNALAKFRSGREAMGPSINIAEFGALTDAFFGSFDLDTLPTASIAPIVRLDGFAFGERAQRLAKPTAERLREIARQPDLEGGLAAALLVRLIGPAKLGAERKALQAQFLRHPALAELLTSEHGDLALDLATNAANSTEDRVLLLNLVDRLDAARSTAPASAVRWYWLNLVEKVPPGEQREKVRMKLVTYLRAAQVQEAADSPRHPVIAETLARLEAPAAQGKLIGGTAPELHFLWTSRGNWKKLSDLRGKVVVLDFWATWCAPCVESFPKIAALAERYRGYEVELLGVTSVQGIMRMKEKSINCRGNPEKEMALMPEYIQERNITWPVVFSREPLMNPEYGIAGVPTVIIIAPDGTVSQVFSGLEEEATVRSVDLLLAKFGHLSPPDTIGQVSSAR